MSDDGKLLSTTALARHLGLPAQELFTALKDQAWISRQKDSWVLTAKGEFEGGRYQDSKRFGRYVVWPESLLEHAAIKAIKDGQRLSAAAMRRYFPRLHARQINRAMAELGLQQHSILGWELTPLGRQFGGEQVESLSAAALYVSWPRNIVEHPVIVRELSTLSDQLPTFAENEPVTDEPVNDLFSALPPVDDYCGTDGHRLDTPLQLTLCNWLYYAQLAHACHRALPTEEKIFADFYLPTGRVYIDCWEEQDSPQRLSQNLQKREYYKKLGLNALEVSSADVQRLDEVLGRGLLAFGVRC